MVKDQIDEIRDRISQHITAAMGAVAEEDEEKFEKHYTLFASIIADVLAKLVLYEDIALMLTGYIRGEDLKNSVLEMFTPIDSDEVNTLQNLFLFGKDFPS